MNSLKIRPSEDDIKTIVLVCATVPRSKAGPRWRGTTSFTTNAKNYLVDGVRRKKYAELNNFIT